MRLEQKATWREEPFPGRFDNPLSQYTPGSGSVSRGLDIVSLFETGYLLTRHYRLRLRRKLQEAEGESNAADPHR